MRMGSTQEYFSSAKFGTIAAALKAAEKRLNELRASTPHPSRRGAWKKARVVRARTCQYLRRSCGLEVVNVAGLACDVYGRPGTTDADSFHEAYCNYKRSYGWSFFEFTEGDFVLNAGACVGV